MVARLALAFLLALTAAANAQPFPVNIGGGSGGTPGGSSGQPQYNNAGAFGGTNTTYYPTALPTPAAPTVTVIGTPGATTYRYTVIPRGGLAYGAASLVTSVTNSVLYTNLNGTNYNQIDTSAVTGATSCDVFRVDTGGFHYFVGNIACGASINDQVPLPSPNYSLVNGNPYTLGRSTGYLIPDNVKITGALSLGDGRAATFGTLLETSGEGVLNIGQTLTGTGFHQTLDPMTVKLIQTLTPGGNEWLSETWNFVMAANVPSTNTYFIPSMRGLVNSINIDGSGTVEQAASFDTGILIAGTMTAGYYALGLGANVTHTATGTYDYLYGAQFTASNTGGQALELGAVTVNFIATGLTTDGWGIKLSTPTGGGANRPTNYRGLWIEDTSGVGSTLSRAILVDGATAISEFVGEARTGKASLKGSSSGLISVLPQAAAGTYNFNLPTTAGTSGYLLTSAGGGSSPMTWTGVGTSGAVIPLLNGNNTYSGVSTFAGALAAAMRVITAAGAVTVSATTDYFLCVNKSSGAATVVNLPASPATGLTYLVKDCKGDASTNNITITPATGNIDGAGTYVINVDRGSVAVSYTGAEWSIN